MTAPTPVVVLSRCCSQLLSFSAVIIPVEESRCGTGPIVLVRGQNVILPQTNRQQITVPRVAVTRWAPTRRTDN